MRLDLESHMLADGVGIETLEVILEELAFLVEISSGFNHIAPLIAVDDVTLGSFQNKHDVAVDVAAATKKGFSFVMLVVLEPECDAFESVCHLAPSPMYGISRFIDALV